jgi:hypothetical protein
MLIENVRSPLVSPTPIKKRRKCRSLYFSSSKALKRSRMTRSKKTVSKVGEATLGDPRRNLRFRGGGSTGDDNASVQSLDAVEENFEGVHEVHNLTLQGAVSNVSSEKFH